MTKYILIGGYPGKIDGGKAFVDELIEGFDEPVRILDCLFARPTETWEEVFEKDTFFFASLMKNREYILEMAEPATFIEQIQRNDAVYFRGGVTKQLMDALKQSPGWEKEVEGKTVAGTSAGADMLARYYYDLDNPGLREGLGILPLKVLVHYGSDYNAPNIDWEKAVMELSTAGDANMELIKLPEGTFVTKRI